MRKQFIVVVACLVIFAVTSPAETRQDRPPTAALGPAINGDDVTFSYSLVAHSGLNFGHGADLSYSHYFTRHFGLRAEGDWLYANQFRLHEYGFRGGPVVTSGRRRGFSHISRA